MKKKIIKLINSNSAHYNVNVNSRLDGFNTADFVKTDNDKNIQEIIKFENNISLTLENIGNNLIHNPRIIINNRRQWFSPKAILESIITSGMNNEEAALSLYNFFSSISVNAHNNYTRVDEQLPDNEQIPSFNSFKERANPVNAVNIYYVSGCISTATNFVILARYLGLEARVLIAAPLSGPYDKHAVVEVFYNGKYHMFDPEARLFFLDKDNLSIASYEDLHNHPELAFRTHGHGFAAPENYSPFINLYRSNYPPYQLPVENWTSTIQIALRPNEKLVYQWSEIGKFRYGNNPRNVPIKPYKLSNGKLVYEPNLEQNLYRKGILAEYNIESFQDCGFGPKLHILKPSQPGQIIIKMCNFYPIVGCQIEIGYVKQNMDDEISLLYGDDSKKWTCVWMAQKVGINIEKICIDDILDAINRKPLREIYIKVILHSKLELRSLGIDSLKINCDLQMTSSSLPALSRGINEIKYSNDTIKETAIKITHEWQEINSFVIPDPPDGAVFPKCNEVISVEELIIFTWLHNNEKDINKYHIYISQREDLLIPVAPNFDRLTYSNKCEFMPSKSFWRKGCKYYWRVRAQSIEGVWSDWSELWRFETK